MKKLEKYKIAPQTKFVKFKVKHFVEIPTIRHDKAVPPLLDCLKSSSPLNVSPPWLLKFNSCPPAWVMTQKSALLYFRTPLGLGLGLRQSFQLRFFMRGGTKVQQRPKIIPPDPTGDTMISSQLARSSGSSQLLPTRNIICTISS